MMNRIGYVLLLLLVPCGVQAQSLATLQQQFRTAQEHYWYGERAKGDALLATVETQAAAGYRANRNIEFRALELQAQAEKHHFAIRLGQELQVVEPLAALAKKAAQELPADHLATAFINVLAARAQYSDGDPTEANRLYDLAKATYERKNQQETLDYALLMCYSAAFRAIQGRLDEGLRAANKGMDLRRKLTASTTPHPLVAYGLQHLGYVLSTIGFDDSSSTLHRQSNRMLDSCLRGPVPEYAINLHNLSVFSMGGECQDTVKLYRKLAREYVDRHFPNTRSQVPVLAFDDIYEAQESGDYEKVDAVLTRIERMYRGHDVAGLSFFYVMTARAGYYSATGQAAKCSDQWKKALDYAKQHLGPKSPQVYEAFKYLALVVPPEAITEELFYVMRDVLNATEALFGVRSPAMLPYNRDYGLMFMNSGQMNIAGELLKRCIEIAENHRLPATKLAGIYRDYATYLVQTQQFANARSTLEQALQFCKQQPCSKTSTCSYLKRSMANLAFNENNPEEALRLLVEARNEFQQDDDKQSVFGVWQDLRIIYREQNNAAKEREATERIEALARELGVPVPAPVPTRAELERQQQERPTQNR